MNKILVTGGAGFIGLRLVEILLDNSNNHIIVVDNFSVKNAWDKEFKRVLEKAGDRIDVIDNDVRKCDLPKDIDQVYHLAAHIGTKSTFDAPHDTINDNIQLMQNIIRNYNKTETKVVYTSTIEVYTGIEQKLPTPENTTIGWNDYLNPRWAYSFGKFVAERLLTSTNTMKWSVARFSNVYGPRMKHDYVVKAIFDRIKISEISVDMFAYEDTRPFIYVDDAVNGLITLMNNPKANNDIFNIGSNIQTKIIDLYRLCLEVTGKNITLLQAPIKNTEYRQPDTSKAKNILGWEMTTQLKEGLIKTWEYYK